MKVKSVGVEICDKSKQKKKKEKKKKQGARIWGNKSFPSCCKLMPKSDNMKR